MSRSGIVAIVAVAGAALGGFAALASSPEPVSPVGVAEARCPTFSWSAVTGAAGYELVIYEVAEDGEVGEEPVASARLPGGATSWTAPGGACLPPGGRFAWSLRVVGEDAEAVWSAPALFEVTAAPSVSEVQAAIATLRRYLAEAREGVPAAAQGGARPAARSSAAGEREPADARPARGGGSSGSIAPAAAPSLGSPSLTLDGNVALGATSHLFKEGSVFLWDDTEGNTALGRLALGSASGTATGNTAFGREALGSTIAGGGDYHGSRNTGIGDQALADNSTGFQNTALGSLALAANDVGSLNTGSGDRALFSNTSGHRNAAHGALALFSNLSGAYNTATGAFALRENVSGSQNTAIGYKALRNATGDHNLAVGFNAGLNAIDGDDNVFIASSGESADDATIRIGTAGTQNRTFIAGIHGKSIDDATDIAVLVDETGKLGTAVSSRRFKEGIEDLGEASERLLDLRPVRFRYKDRGEEGAERYGLIAEEVAEVFPELVVDDAEGRPYTVRYHVLAPLLLNQLQRTHRDLERAEEELARHRAELEALERRLAALERRNVSSAKPYR